jgi:hypothetical protein
MKMLAQFLGMLVFLLACTVGGVALISLISEDSAVTFGTWGVILSLFGAAGYADEKRKERKQAGKDQK